MPNQNPSNFSARAAAISHRYGRKAALDGITLDIPARRMAGLVGPDGVGKSSLLALIAGVRKIQTGTLEVLGGDIRQARHRNTICPRIAYMPQGLGKNLYMTLSVFENLEFFGRLFGQARAERARRIDELLASTGMLPFKHRPAGTLSGGMKQKLGLCCSLLHDPDLLILDEPTTGVDPLSRRQFWELIRRIRRERPEMSVLVSTAYMDEAEGFDWLAAMDGGKILAEGSPAELKTRVGAADLDEAFIRLLPESRRLGHKDLVVPPREVAGDGTPAIEAEGLTRRFGDFTAVDGVSFRIPRGEIFGFLGSNGCGKTTTMKMLTGLLPATAGKAYMFGEPVTAGNLESRKRIGFMSQAFSLYSELTVWQNLELHARLYHLPADSLKARVEEMIEQFDLKDYARDMAESLPLGTRQRLSLAVAMIHKPELLILDEPTSGVDPVARVNFWEHLIHLSRRDKVTIFVSTHFMNEAGWCDRISLMHAGRVLASDAPDRLVKDSGARTLEEAFIHHLEKATSPAEPAKGPPPGAASVSTHALSGGFSLRRMLGYAYRESLEVRRDPIRLTFALAGTAILMLVLGLGLNMDVKDITFAALDRDQTPASRAYIENMEGSPYFIAQPPIVDEAEMETRLRGGKLNLVLEIPSGFGRDFKRGRPTEIGAWVDGTMPSRAESVSAYAQSLHAQFLERETRPVVAAAASVLEMRYRYNQDYKSLVAMAPGTIAILLMLIPAMLMALGVVREKELGSITNFYATPVTKLEFIFGKQLPYVALGLINFFCLTGIAVFLFGVPLKGSFPALLVGAFLYIWCTTGLGLFMSAFTKTQIAAIFGTAIATILPATQFSGLTQPTSSLEGGAAFIGRIYPTAHFITISRGAFTKALGFADLSGPLFVLLLSIPVLTAISWSLLKKQET